MRNLNIRLPDPLHERLKQAAARDDRSLNGEILWLLKIGLDVRDTTPDPGGQP
jgi:predicted HicB family RNase H-like nuclease